MGRSSLQNELDKYVLESLGARKGSKPEFSSDLTGQLLDKTGGSKR